MQCAAGLVGKQHLRIRELRTDIGEKPPQHQVQAIEHRHPSRARSGCVSSLAEPHMQLAERAAPEMDVGTSSSAASSDRNPA